eukprot:12256795-Alexandrium_andersonii.AAC.1
MANSKPPHGRPEVALELVVEHLQEEVRAPAGGVRPAGGHHAPPGQQALPERPSSTMRAAAPSVDNA